MNINVYVPFLTNTLDTIVKGWKYTKYSPPGASRSVMVGKFD